MSKRRAIAAGIAVLLALSAIAFWLLRPRDPVFRGKPTSYWIRTLATNNVPLDQRLQQWSSFGANGTAMLLKALQTGTLKHQRAYQNAWPKLPGVLKRILPPPDPAINIHVNAMYLLSRIGANGANATPAIPILIDILKSDPERLARFNAVETLAKIGLGSADVPDSQRHEVVTSLIAATRDADAMVRMGAAGCLGNTSHGAWDTEVVSALAGCLTDTDGLVRYRAVNSLLLFGPSASNAVPALAKMSQDPDPSVRAAAAAAVQKIKAGAIEDRPQK